MKTKDFWYDLPEELIAQVPAEPRDRARLLSYDKATGAVEHGVFHDLPALLRPDDLLVVNDTRVLPARLYGTKAGSSLGLELLLLRRVSVDTWEVIMKPGRKMKVGDEAVFSPELSARVLSKGADGVCTVQLQFEGVFEEILERVGHVPLPPYIHETGTPAERYQTVYARHNGSAAAPTAGLHFTPALLQDLAARGIETARLVLHVGLGTFRPVKEENVEDHSMHSEHIEVPEATAEAVNRAHRQGRRVIAVGTTSVRALESAWDGARVRACAGDTDIFIVPGYRFHTVDGLITNFHLPESTLLMLVSAFAGSRDEMLRVYRIAVQERYRFFSFGDAMLIS